MHDRMRRPSKFQFAFTFALLSLSLISTSLICSRALATVTINGAPSASRWDASKVTLYGGVAGVSTSTATPDPNGLLDTCTSQPTGVLLAPCNSNAVHPSLVFAITYTSDKSTGVPVMVFSTSTTTTGVNTTYSHASVPAKQAATFTTTWGDICKAVGDANGQVIDDKCVFANTVDVANGAYYEATFKVGISTTGSTSATPEDYVDVKVNISTVGTNSGNDSVATICDNATTGVCKFSVSPGDEKVVIKSLEFNGKTSFNGYKMKVLWAEGDGAYGAITSGSPSYDLTFVSEGSRTDLDSSKVDSGLQNDVIYTFKVALMDQAGNVGFYTETGTADTECSGSTVPNCHVAQPGEVVGVLEEPLSCFIATAAYGSPLAPQVETFRKFRDAVLMPSDWGKKFVRFYYKHSPRYAEIIEESPVLRAVARITLWPLLVYAWISIKFGSVTAFTVLLFGSFAFAAAIWAFGKWIRSGGARA